MPTAPIPPVGAPALSEAVSLVAATAMGLVVAARADAPIVLARLAGSASTLDDARAWLLTTDVMPEVTRRAAALLLERARGLVTA